MRKSKAFTAEWGWGKYHQPRNLLVALVAELAELFQWREEAPKDLPGWTSSEREALSDELSDGLIYLIALANKCHVDLPAAALRRIEKNCLKYPAKQVYGSSKKYRVSGISMERISSWMEKIKITQWLLEDALHDLRLLWDEQFKVTPD